MDHVKIAPSLISADFSKLGSEIAQADKGGVDFFHWDVMDGHFVPNITLGPSIIKSNRSMTKLPFIAHLMIESPDKFVKDYINAGCQYITVHAETCKHLHRTINIIRELGAKPGIALNPSTTLSVLDYVIEDVDLVLIMTVNPGFSGQKFIKGILPKIVDARKLINDRNPRAELEIDGGITPETAPLAVKAGASIIVAASAIFDGNNRIIENITKLRNAIKM